MPVIAGSFLPYFQRSWLSLQSCSWRSLGPFLVAAVRVRIEPVSSTVSSFARAQLQLLTLLMMAKEICFAFQRAVRNEFHIPQRHSL